MLNWLRLHINLFEFVVLVKLIVLYRFCNSCCLVISVRRVPPRFSKAPDPVYEVMPGENLNISCVAVGSPMPYVQWKKVA